MKKLTEMEVLLLWMIREDAGITGYDLNKKMTSQYFYKPSSQQVYRCLKNLFDCLLIKCELARQTDKPDKKKYFLTSLGVEKLAESECEILKGNKSNTVAFLVGNKTHLISVLEKLKNDHHSLQAAIVRGDGKSAILIQRQMNLLRVEIEFAQKSLEYIGDK